MSAIVHRSREPSGTSFVSKIESIILRYESKFGPYLDLLSNDGKICFSRFYVLCLSCVLCLHLHQ